MFNKKMITMLVLLTVLVAGTVNAEEPSYKVYGVLNTSMDIAYDSEFGETSQYAWLSSNTSRFGIKGARDLEPGVTFIWQFECGFDMAHKDFVLSNRNTFVGVKRDNIGTILLGIHDTPMKMLGRKAEMFNEQFGDHRTSMFGWDRRLDNLAMWKSPNWDGFSLAASYQFNEAEIGVGDDLALSMNAMYQTETLLFGGAFETYGESYPGVEGDSPSAFRFVGRYTGEKFAFSGMYHSVSVNDDVTAAAFVINAKYAVNEKYTVKGGFASSDANTDSDLVEAVKTISISLDRTWSKGLMNYLEVATVVDGDYLGRGLSHFGASGFTGNGHGSWVMNADWVISTGWKVYF